jgi:hypothetical protein
MTDAKAYVIRHGDRIAEIEWSRALSLDELEAALRDLVQAKAFRNGMALLLIDRASASRPTHAEIEAAVRSLVENARQMDRHVAMVVDSEFQYEIGMVYSECADRLGMILMPFRDLGTARQWLVAQMSDSHYYPIPPEIEPKK